MARLSFPVYVLCLVMSITVCGQCDDGAALNNGTDETAKSDAAVVKVSVQASEKTDVRTILESLSKQAKEKILMESTVKGSVSGISLNDVSLEKALSVVCSSGKLQWRKIYIDSESKLLDQPDRFAATVRLMSGLGFPDLMITGSSNGKVQVHLEDAKLVERVENLSETLKMTRVYLITNDLAIAAKAKAQEAAEAETKAGKFAKLSKDQMDMFMEMTPEEREQALISNLSLVEQVGPEYTAAVMESLANIDPSYLHNVAAKQIEMLFSLSSEQRRKMMKFNIEAMKAITPEQMKILQEDALAVAQEMQGESNE